MTTETGFIETQTGKTPEEYVAHLIAAIESGKKVYIATALSLTVLNMKTLQRFRSAGYELLVAKGDSIYLRSGRRLDCINFCRITVI